MKKILLIFGTRPEAIKMAPLVKLIQSEQKKYKTYVCVTGQHREMLDQVLEIFDIQPDYDINIMKSGQDLFDITSKVLLGVRDVLNEVCPDLVLVHGDTTTSTAAALASFYQQIPVGHVEAGLRTYNMKSPWPEEMNRQITGRISTYHFAPTKTSKENLIKENSNEKSIVVTGNTVIDALFLILERIKNDGTLIENIKNQIKFRGYNTNRLNERKLVLITGHRRENFGEGFLNICQALKTLSTENPEVDFLYPMHLNPNVRKPINDIFNDQVIQNMFFIEPLDYLHFVFLLDKCHFVLTDSGGVQEEAPSLGKPVLVMRDTTERPEALDAGTVELVGTSYNTIVEKATLLLNDSNYYSKMSMAMNPYGDGKASQRIVDFLDKNILP
ncbi:MAG: UDP-N-acetylglucosamine 2-epimerase (non-hydrolyzing) [Bacteroidales bacterium]|jgi:UDP-N-acetylglucosamine 2-epimerase (non-hydrolysing)|nr:UDP-N-acetylglucosamine 2-epimerase (non-hydrolyzing) [Bacteroidales bacterium]NCU34634.1 UDP-N-acetylglucosamine 2-epimerase (non-hydrolyzing) [Candidatus Falkowbacteria bacterium]MDD3131177.1 UDP-N-acetylglucosamine 2-epimerase (non-hydrolyzing) [Bacteroidales bacterium]MDD4176323.1 UDP-N-acetylglucosamine 2-epimerase (non-hydrolyzing) [Bacteroidales bacterium]MDD4741128.1 UDP-N-acetylglucosamine 2-epimerase (non-hydrolyzing) [Bacteroidales bacterium]